MHTNRSTYEVIVHLNYIGYLLTLDCFMHHNILPALEAECSFLYPLGAAIFSLFHLAMHFDCAIIVNNWTHMRLIAQGYWIFTLVKVYNSHD